MAYSDEEKTKIVTEICDRIAEEGIAVRKAITEAKMSSKTFFKWLKEDKEKGKQYARATDARADKIFEEMLDIADDGTNDWMERLDKDGQPVGWILNGEHIQRSKLRIDTRKWHLSKLNPKKFGDKIDVTSDNEKITVPPVEFRVITKE